MREWVVRPALLLVMAAAAGCAAQRPNAPPPPPPVHAEVGYRLGSLLDSPDPAKAAAPSGHAMVLLLEGYAVPKPPAAVGESLSARGNLVVDSVNEPFAAAPPAAEAVRLVVDPAALPPPGRAGAVVSVRAPLPPGCTAVVSFVAVSSGATGSLPPLKVGIVSPPGPGDRPRLTVTARMDEPAGERQAGSAVWTPGESARERTLLIDWPLPETEGEFALLFPLGPARECGRRRPRASRPRASLPR